MPLPPLELLRCPPLLSSLVTWWTPFLIVPWCVLAGRVANIGRNLSPLSNVPVPVGFTLASSRRQVAASLPIGLMVLLLLIRPLCRRSMEMWQPLLSRPVRRKHAVNVWVSSRVLRRPTVLTAVMVPVRLLLLGRGLVAVLVKRLVSVPIVQPCMALNAVSSRGLHLFSMLCRTCRYRSTLPSSDLGSLCLLGFPALALADMTAVLVGATRRLALATYNSSRSPGLAVWLAGFLWSSCGRAGC